MHLPIDTKDRIWPIRISFTDQTRRLVALLYNKF